MKSPIHIECLDVRIAPAGVVVLDYNAVTGALSLEGDLETNSVSIFKTGAKTFRVEGFDDTIIENGNGPTLGLGAFFDIGKLTSLTVDLGAGDDELFLTNVTLASADLIFGAGNDLLEAENAVVKGTTNLNFGDAGGEAIFGGPV